MTDLPGMYLLGLSFFDCAEICEREAEETKNITRSVELQTPFIVNCAFACEIFLKFLLSFYKIDFKREHDLKKLFDLLPKDVQNKVNERQREKFGTLQTWYGGDILQTISNAFIEWRYKYEKRQLHNETSFLFLFTSILKQICEEKLGWKGYNI